MHLLALCSVYVLSDKYFADFIQKSSHWVQANVCMYDTESKQYPMQSTVTCAKHCHLFVLKHFAMLCFIRFLSCGSTSRSRDSYDHVEMSVNVTTS